MDITISDATYSRLAAQAKGFETPEQVINRLIDVVEIDHDTRPELFFNPEGEADFKKALLKSKQAKVEMFKRDGSCETGVWNARAISEESSVRANIWSGYLRGWKEKGIVRAVFTVQEVPDLPGAAESVQWNDYTISRTFSGGISVQRNGMPVTIVKPFLRDVADDLKISLLNSNGNEMNTRQLGAAIIKKLNNS